MTAAKRHNLTVWRRDRHGSAWTWMCSCGARYHDDLPSHETARAEAYAHRRAADTGDAQHPTSERTSHAR